MLRLLTKIFISLMIIILAGSLLLVTPFTQQAIKNYVWYKITADTFNMVRIGKIKGGFSRRFILENVEFKMKRVKLAARKISIKYHPNLLLWGNIIIEELAADGVKIKIYQAPVETGSKKPADPGSHNSWLKYIEIKKINLGAAEIEYHRKGQPPLSFKKVNISAAMYYDFVNSSMKLNIAQIGWVSEFPALSLVRSSGEVVYTRQDLRISGFRIQLPRSSLYLDGFIKNFQFPKVYLKCKSDRFDGRDLPALKNFSHLLGSPLTFDLVANGDLSMLRWVAQAKSGQSRLSGRGIVDVLGLKKHSFTFDGEFSHLNLADLRISGFSDTDFNGTIQGTGRGNKPWNPEMQLVLTVQDSYFGPYQIYPSEFTLAVSSATITAATNLLNTNFGHFVFQGIFDAPDPTHGIRAGEVSLKFDQFNIKPLLRSVYLGSNLNGAIDLKVRNLRWRDWQQVEWSTTVDIGKSNLAKIKIQRLRLEAARSFGKITITKGQVESDLADAKISGYFENQGTTDLQCQAEVKDLSLIGNVFPAYRLAGKVDFNAKIIGLADNPEARWHLGAQKIRFKQYILSALSCSGTYKNKRFDYEIVATGKPNQVIEVKGVTDIQKAPVETAVEMLKIQFLDQIWTNAQSFTVKIAPRYLALDDLIVGNRGQVARAKGILDWTKTSNFTISLENLQLDNLNKIYTTEQNISGTLNSYIAVAGNAAQPVIKSRVEIKDLEIKPVYFEKYGLELDYARGTWDLRGQASSQSKPAFELEGTWQYPVNFDQPLPDIWGSAVDLRIRLDRLPLDFLQTLLPAITSARGFLNSNIEVKGTLLNPDIEILANTNSCDLKLRDLPKPFTSIQAKAKISDQKLTLEYLLAAVKDGKFQAAGMGNIEKLQLANFDFTFKIINGPVYYPGIFAATVNADGSFKRQSGLYALSAEVEALDGIIEIKHSEREKQADLVYADEISRPAVQKAAELVQDSFYDRLAMDFKIHSEGNIWYKLDTSKAELVGDLHIQKPVKGVFAYLGSIKIKQGYYDFLRNRFIITRGELQFPGIAGFNPLLNIDGEYRELSEIMITATIRGDLNNPLIQLHSDPPQKDIEILSYLLFGKSSQNLSSREASSVESQVLSFIGRTTVLKVRDILGDKVTIDTLDIKKDATTQNWRVSVGKYIGRKLFVSYTFGFSAEAEDKLRLEYKLTRCWNIESEISQKHSAGADLFWTIDY
ncbi:MAG: translocation/assembly module TamB [Elusimicrobia bacterium]|nr:translocation/assembly module TamB [Elusimicrobiota bacterium]